MKKQDLTIITIAALLALSLFILNRSGILSPKQAPKTQEADDIAVTIIEQGANSKQTITPLPLMSEDSKRWPAQSYLRISVNNRIYEPISLAGDSHINIRREGGYHNEAEVKDGIVRMVFSTCDNQLCVKQGALSIQNRDLRALYHQIICLPNEVVLEVLDENETKAFFGENTPDDAAHPLMAPLLYSILCLAFLFILRLTLRLLLGVRRK
ncbi:MAG: NusG domain II-containing protein [Clostridiales bacterium]|nr:NusG domain II-containing protein [Clostridiales bacterium]